MRTHFLLPLVMCITVALSSPGFALDPRDTPLLSCEDATGASITLKICSPNNGETDGAGDTATGTGTEAGISIHWRTRDSYEADIAGGGNGWGGEICELSLSGQPSMQHPDKSRWELLAGECETIIIGDINFDETGVSGNECALEPLACDTEYVFRTFAHAGRGLGRSEFSDPVFCTTDACDDDGEGCSFTQGYWKTHGPTGCQTGNNTNEWPVTALTLGTVNYTDAQLCSILNQPAQGNGLIVLAHQLIASKLNVANNTDVPCQDVLDDIAAADAMIGSLVVPPVGSGSLSNGSVSGLNGALTDFNEGDRCDGTWLHCDTDPTPGRPLTVEDSSFGKVKSGYR